MPPDGVPHTLTVDLEDWYQGLEIDMSEWDGFQPRVERGLSVLLALLEEAGIRATFFVLGFQARRTGAMVRDLAARGHEVASHGWSHRFVYRLGRDAFRAEVRDSKKLLEDLAGTPVLGYRAPFFSITRESLWALDILLEEGYRYDSSIFPVMNYRYGIPGARRVPGPLRTPKGASIFEIPLSAVRIGGRLPVGINVPVSGGGYFRLYPYAVTRALVRALARGGESLVFYVHPWEYDPDHPRIKMPRVVPWFTHYFNLSSTREKTRRLLADFRFVPIREAYDAALGT